MLELPVGDPEVMRRKARQLRHVALLVVEVATALDRRVAATPYAGRQAELFRAAMARRRREAGRISDDVRQAAWQLSQASDRVEAGRLERPL